MSVTNYAINKMLDYDFGSVSYTPPTIYYVGLSTTTSAASSIAISGSLMTEPSSGSYARVALGNNDKTNFTVASSGSLSIKTDINFVESSGSWGTITNIGLWDSITTGSGNLWFFQALLTPKIIQVNTTATFSASAVTFSITN